MNHNLQAPLALLRAQATLWMRTGELMQEARKGWLTLADHELARETAETHAEADEAAHAQDWSGLAAWPMHAGWRLMSQALAEAHDVALTAANIQAAWLSGMQAIASDWQRDLAQALGPADEARH